MVVAKLAGNCLGPQPTFIERGDLGLADGSTLRVRHGYCTRYGYAVIWHGKVKGGKNKLWGFRSGRRFVSTETLAQAHDEVEGVIFAGTIKVPLKVMASQPWEFREMKINDGALIQFSAAAI